MELEARIQDQVQVVTVLAERIDSAIAIRFKDEMRAVTEGGPVRVILDLGEVRFVDSSGLGAIVAAMKHLAPVRKLELAGLNPDVDKVFRLTRMNTVFAIHADVQAAMGVEAPGGAVRQARSG
jgi:anti-sigma B factor antagonist